MIPTKCKSELFRKPIKIARELIKSNNLQACISQQDRNSHKGSGGKFAVIGGCSYYTGAPYFSGISTLYGVNY